MKSSVPRFTPPRPARKTDNAWQTWHEQARNLVRTGRLADAIPLFVRTVEAVPHLHDPRRDLASTYYKLGRLGDALREFNEVAVRFPDRSDAANNVAGVLCAMDYQPLALQSVERALALDPTNVAALNNLAEILKHMGDWAGAREVYAMALTLEPGNAKGRMQHGMTMVALGDWAQGWAELESREAAISADVLFTEKFTSPRWTGNEPLEGTRLLVQHEQGLGDSIMCARFARLLAARGAQVHWRCPAPLVELLGTVEGMASVTATGSAVPVHDRHIPVMSLLAALGITERTLDGSDYLRPAGTCPPAVESLLPRDGTPTVSLTWAGNPLHTNDHRRSMKGDLLADILAIPNVRFVAMQKHPAVHSVLPASLHERITDIGVHCHSFTDSAHALRRVDLVVTVDTSVAHLAGGLGVPTIVCLPLAPDYRWGAKGQTTPWYGNMTLLRQREAMQWGPALDDIMQRVAALRG
ncbi:tetratricopeptide repeat protein [Gemmatimonas sp.]|jgi:Flp pilus assembly protein TadD|uniref:tetratricopeptide repeat protein n=1 Tax=Gemmatimonas sp. TaxID=1962908 RepID=UPI0037C068D2